MMLLLVGFAILGLLGVIANLFSMIGKVVVGLLKYVVGPITLFLIIMMIISVIARGGH